MTRRVDCAVIGAGPAGLQLGYFLKQAGREHVIIEAGEVPGSFFGTYPRSRRLISYNKVHSVSADPEVQLRWDWNSLLTRGQDFRYGRFDQSILPHADQYCRYLGAFAQEFGLAIDYRTRVLRISRPAETFLVETSRGEPLEARYLVMATGMSKPYLPPIPGIELAEGYESVPMTAAAFCGQRILILGKGNSAFEVAEVALESAALVHVASPHPIRFAWQTHHAGDLRGTNVRLLDMYQLKMLNSALDCEVSRIEKTADGLVVPIAYAHAEGERETMRYDRVIRCTGFRFDTSVFSAECAPRLTIQDRFPAMTSMWESVNVPGLFFAGTLMQAIDHRHASSAFIAGYRYNIRTLSSYLGRRYHGDAGAPVTLPAEAGPLADWVLRRVSTTTALWVQFELLCDLVTVDGPGTRVYRELPVGSVPGEFAPPHGHYFTICFEWGTWDGDVFAIHRHPRSEMAHTNVFLHPVLRCYRDGDLVAEHHVLEDLMGNYRAGGENGTVVERGGRPVDDYHDRQHRAPLVRFFDAHLAGAGR